MNSGNPSEANREFPGNRVVERHVQLHQIIRRGVDDGRIDAISRVIGQNIGRQLDHYEESEPTEGNTNSNVIQRALTTGVQLNPRKHAHCGEYHRSKCKKADRGQVRRGNGGDTRRADGSPGSILRA